MRTTFSAAIGLAGLVLLFAVLPGGSSRAQSALPASLPVDTLTSNEDLARTLTTVASDHAEAELSTIGESVGGLPIHAVTLTRSGSSNRPKARVLLFAQQHGDEPSGAEALQLVVHELLTGEVAHLLDSLDIVIIPRVNPDGAAVGSRRNANEFDLNRDHVILSQPETRALHAIARDWQPHLSLDIHEYGALGDDWVDRGFVRDAQVTLGAMSNPNTDPGLRSMAKRWIEAVGEDVTEAGFRFAEYTVGDPFGSSRMRFSTTDANDARNGLAFLPALSFIQEGKEYGGSASMIHERTMAQRASVLALLTHAAAHTSELRAEVSRAKRRDLNPAPDDRAALQYDYFPDSSATIDLPTFNLYEWMEEERSLHPFHSLVRVKRSLPLPVGYLVRPGEEALRLLDILGRHGYGVGFFSDTKRVRVEEVTLLHVTRMEEEEMEVPNVDIARVDTVLAFPPHSVYIPIAQPGGRRLPVLLEAQSTRGLLAEGAAFDLTFGDWLVEGSVFPIYRVLEAPPRNPALDANSRPGDDGP